jgi:hypothetical protein
MLGKLDMAPWARNVGGSESCEQNIVWETSEYVCIWENLEVMIEKYGMSL